MNNINETLKSNLCNGCGICVGICPVKAISIKINEDGFYRPKISSKCINCGKCLSACSGIDENVEAREVNFTDDVFGNYKSVYSGWALDENVRKNSSSGGVIRTLLNHYSDSFDGVISLVDSKENPLVPEIKVLNDSSEILNISKSKYFACEFSKAADFLSKNTGKYIIVGLPCHIASLKKAQNNLKAEFVSIEVFCGAIYSHLFMDKYLKHHLKKERPKSIDFRDKITGWHNFSLTVKASLNANSTDANNDLFYFAQRNKFFTQERCLKCSLCYRGQADITVGDFWGPKYVHDEEGISLIIARTSVGENLIENCETIYQKKEYMTDVQHSQPWFVEIHKRNINSRQYDEDEIFPKNDQLEYINKTDIFRKAIRKIDENSLFNKKIINNSMFRLLKKHDDISNIRAWFSCEIEYIKETKEELLYKIFNLARKIFTKPQRTSESFLIIPSDCSFGSFGDQAMMLSLIENIKSKNPKAPIGVFMMYESPADYFLFNQGIDVAIYCPVKNNERENYLTEIIKKYSNLIVVGADILDGGCGVEHSLNYFSLIKIANKNRLTTAISGFSYNSENIPEIINNFKEISSKTILNVRDIFSYQRLKKNIRKNLNLTADIAFLFNEKKYQTSNYCKNLIAEINKEKKEGQRFIGVHLTFKTGAEEEKEEFIKKTINAFQMIQERNEKISFILLPHDKRVHPHIYPDDEFLQLMQNRFQSAGIKNVLFAKDIKNAIDIKNVVACLELVITSRMHLAIAAFSKNVPVISFVYQNKFEGLYDFYKFDKKFMHEKADFSVDNIVDEINYVLKNHKTITEKIEKKNKYIFKLAGENKWK